MPRRAAARRMLPPLLAALALAPPLAAADPDAEAPATPAEPRWRPQLYARGKAGDRIIGELGLLGPVLQGSRTLLFTDLRGRVDDDEVLEGNFGLGARRILGDDRAILGGYAYFDALRSENDNVFLQATLGAEFWTEDHAARVNGYLAERDDKTVRHLGTLPPGPRIAGDRVQIVRGRGMRLIERALPGFDFELGRRLPVLGSDLWLHAGYFRFDANGYERVDGPRLRAEWDLDLGALIPNSRLVLGGEWQRDDVRGSLGFGSLELRIALGGAGAAPARSARAERWTDRRMVKRVERDIDVVAGGRRTGADQTLEPGRNPDTGAEYGPILFAQPGASGGGGSESDPAGLAAAAGMASDDGIILVVASGTATGPVALANDGLVLLGGGGFLDVQSGSGELFRLPLAGVRPTVSFAGADALSATGVRDVTIRNLDLEGGGGLRLTDTAGRIDVGDVTVRNSTATGVDVQLGSADLSFDNLVVEQSAGTGVRIENATGTARFTGLSIENDGAGAGLRAAGLSALDLLGTNEIVAGGGGAAVHVDGMAGTTALDATFDALESNGSGAEGILLEAVSGSFTVLGVTSITGATGAGIAIRSASVDAEFLGAGELPVEGGTPIPLRTTITNSAGAAVSLADLTGSVRFADLDVDHTVVSGPGVTGSGPGFEADNAASIEISNGTIDTADGGPALRVVGGSDPTTLTARLSQLGSTGSPTEGLLLDNVAGSFLVSGATAIAMSGASGIEIRNSSAQVTFLGGDTSATTVADAGADGILLRDNTGTFTILGGGGVSFAMDGDLRALRAENVADLVIDGSDTTGTLRVGDGFALSGAGTGAGAPIDAALSLSEVEDVFLRFLLIENVGDAGADESGVAVDGTIATLSFFDSEIRDVQGSGFTAQLTGTENTQVFLLDNALDGVDSLMPMPEDAISISIVGTAPGDDVDVVVLRNAIEDWGGTGVRVRATGAAVNVLIEDNDVANSGLGYAFERSGTEPFAIGCTPGSTCPVALGTATSDPGEVADVLSHNGNGVGVVGAGVGAADVSLGGSDPSFEIVDGAGLPTLLPQSP